MSNNKPFSELLKETAIKLGFSHCSFSLARKLKRQEKLFRSWLSSGYHAGMSYLEKNVEKRFNPSLLTENAKTLITLVYPYGDAETAYANKSGIALYAWGEDYHIRLRKKAKPLLDLLTFHYPDSKNCFFIDSVPLSERSFAVEAGVGWIGKNGTLITPERGSMVYLAEIVTTVELPANSKTAIYSCGDCSLCIEACPTSAINNNNTIDASKCISYHTNTSTGAIPSDIAAKLDDQIFGCDICQQVCPWNKRGSMNLFIKDPTVKHFEKTPPELREWAKSDLEWFRKHFKDSALAHTGYKKIASNIRSLAYYSPELFSPHEKEEN